MPEAAPESVAWLSARKDCLSALFGLLGRMLRNPTYTGIGPQFWRSMDMLSGESIAWGTPNCGKGQPGQIGHTGHPAAPARFSNVRVGVRA